MTMLYRPDSRELAVLSKLARFEDGGLELILKQELQTTLAMLMKAPDDAQMRQLQGRACLAQGLLDALKSARDK